MTEDPCAERHLLLQAELDGELDAAQAASLAAHVQTCPDCAALRERLGALSAGLRRGASRHVASPELRLRIRAQSPPRLRVGRRAPWGHAASFAGGMALAASVALVAVLPGRGGEFTPQIVAAHIRALQPGHLLDVVSTDQHTVKPWFDGRLDYAPPVRDLASAGFALIGGRLDYVAGRPVAVLVYRRGGHLIDVFVWPGAAADAAGGAQGYNVVGWRSAGMVWRAVSDLNAAELADFARLMRSDE